MKINVSKWRIQWVITITHCHPHRIRFKFKWGLESLIEEANCIEYIISRNAREAKNSPLQAKEWKKSYG